MKYVDKRVLRFTLRSQYFKIQRCCFQSYKICNYSSSQEIYHCRGTWLLTTTTFTKVRPLNLSWAISVHFRKKKEKKRKTLKRHSKTGNKQLSLFGNGSLWPRGVDGFKRQESTCYCRGNTEGNKTKEGVEDSEQWITLATSWILHSSVVRWAHKHHADLLWALFLEVHAKISHHRSDPICNSAVTVTEDVKCRGLYSSCACPQNFNRSPLFCFHRIVVCLLVCSETERIYRQHSSSGNLDK